MEVSKRTSLPEDMSNLLEKGKVVVLSRTSCPYCEMAAEYLEAKGVKFEYIVADKIGITNSQRDQVEKMTGARTYPRIWVGNTSVGGYSELHNADKKDLLDKWLEAEGIEHKKGIPDLD